MNNYSVTFSILGYYFQIITHEFRLCREQVKHIKKFCTTKVQKATKETKITATIEYIEDEKHFNQIRKEFEKHDTKIVQSFEGTFFLKYADAWKEYFCQLKDEWILIKNNNQSYVVIGNGVNKTTKYPFRLIREIILRKQEEAGKIFMHATSMVVNGKGIAVLGNKKSGKTTFFTKTLEKHEAEIISDDRVFFYKDGSEFKMEYFPVSVVYQDGTVFSLADLPNIFEGISLRERARIDALVFVKFHPKWDREFDCKSLDMVETIPLLMDTCFTPIDYESKRKEWVYFRKVSGDVLCDNASNLIVEMSRGIKAYFVEFGKNADVDQILREIMRE